MTIAGDVVRTVGDIVEIRKLPTVSIDLMHERTHGNDPFFSRVVEDFYAETQRRHPKLPLIRTFSIGVALCELPQTFDAYLATIEASARRNYKKALRNGYSFARISLNDHGDDVCEIRRSTDVRQGRVSEVLLAGETRPCTNPTSSTRDHDYPYFGVIQSGKLFAYAGCLVAGELCMIEHILGHAARQPDGIVPMLIIGIAQYVMCTYPQVKWYGYGTYYGAKPTMRRFKTKFNFTPHRVRWTLGGAES